MELLSDVQNMELSQTNWAIGHAACYRYLWGIMSVSCHLLLYESIWTFHSNRWSNV